MIIYFLALWAVAAPMGWLAGDVFHSQNKIEGDASMYRVLGAAFPPAGAVMAIVAILKSEMKP